MTIADFRTPPVNSSARAHPPCLAARTADLLFDDPAAQPDFEPDTLDLSREAVAQLGQRFAELPGVVSAMLKGARAGAELLSADRFQGISEIIQNADDAGATAVHFVLEPDALLVKHDGRPINLRDVLALATPWLTTKREDARATGRFGIGLMTLRSLSSVLEVFSDIYSIRLGAPTIDWVDRPAMPHIGETDGATLFRIPLEPGAVSEGDVESWLRGWDDAAIIFCTSVVEVSFAVGERRIRTLSMGWGPEQQSTTKLGSRIVSVSRREATARDGRRWIVSSAEPDVPVGVRRASKAMGESTTIGIALPVGFVDEGRVYAGLPVMRSRTNARVNAQFDPLASRQGVAATQWNEAVGAMAADLWVSSVAETFSADPRMGWCLIPLVDPDTAESLDADSSFDGAVARRSTSILPEVLTLAVGRRQCRVRDLAVEAQDLEGVLSESETARLSGLEFAVPGAARDEAGAWRKVLAFWREADVQLPSEVTTDVAMTLFLEPERAVQANVLLAAAAIREGLEHRLVELPCVATEDGERVAPPVSPAAWVLVTESDDLGSELGLSRKIHPVYLSDSSEAKSVQAWLRSTGALVEGADTHALLARLAAAGTAGRRLPHVLTDNQLRALREAFERLAADVRATVGAGVGRAVMLDCYTFDARGRRRALQATPAGAYLSKRIDRERLSFAAAAAQTPALVWIEGRYADVLRSGLGRAGIGAQKFLRLLGAETAPRLIPHPQLCHRYASERRLGLARDCMGSPAARTRALVEHGATYTLDDRYSPDLTAVVASISEDRRARRRRDRAVALLAALGRAWDRMGEFAEVTAANDNYGWQGKGTVRAFWVWEAAAIPWLDDAEATPRPPHKLRVRTPATIAVHGAAGSAYVHEDLHRERHEVLMALGVAGEPSSGDLVTRLKSLRLQPVTERTAIDAAMVYQALGQRLGERRRIPGDLPPHALSRAFEENPLIYTNLGWRRASEVLAGKPIFGKYRAFAPSLTGAQRLWSTVRVRNVGLADCVAVLAETGRGTSPPDLTDQAVILDSLRMLQEQAERGIPKDLSRRLRRLPLWTSAGWMRDRPVYAVEDTGVACGLGTRVPVWQPGGEIEQFRRLFSVLRLTEVATDDAVVVQSSSAELNEDVTDLYRTAMAILREDLARNEPSVASTLRFTWDALAEVDVRIHSGLEIEVPGISGPACIVVPISAKLDLQARVLYLRDLGLLPKVDGGGRAVAAMFTADKRRLAQAWLAACDAAEAGIRAARIQLADERATADEAEAAAAIEARLLAFGRSTASAHEKVRRRGAGAAMPPARMGTPHVEGLTAGRSRPPARVLVDPASLRLADANGRLEGPRAQHSDTGTSSRNRASGNAGDVPTTPDRMRRPPSDTAPPREYTSLSKEAIGLELVRMVLASDADEVIDLRAQRGVGADAIDALDRYFELKVYAGPEPDRITLEESQIRRALSTPDFFLIIVSEVEGATARPKVRIIVDPVAQLRMAESSSVSFTGVRTSQALMYEFARGE